MLVSAWLTVYLVARIGIATLFISSALHKLKHLNRIDEPVRELAPMAGRAAWVLGVAALVAEAFIVTAVLIGNRWVIVGFLTATALVALYATLQVVSLSTGRRVDCNCFELPGSQPTGFSFMTVVRNLLIMALGGAGVLGFSKLGRIPQYPEHSSWLYLLAVVVGLAVAGSLARLGQAKVNRAAQAMGD